MVNTKKGGRKWTMKYKKSIDCNRPKGFSQRQYCKYGRTKKRRMIHKKCIINDFSMDKNYRKIGIREGVKNTRNYK